ncbi:AAA family ATPase [Virgibacillus litoralis]|uniref:Pilus assembly protein CpaE n=1 Tax=Virgibacillus litoralis TaxID=578221 RepID=A0ABS4HBF0_9BACI|nr:pilus assembly protein CpaE [Virgibacillus litoralis]
MAIDTAKKRQIVAVCSATGGQGRTTVTVNLAAFLAARGSNVSIIDGDLQFGDLAMALDLDPILTIKEIAERDDSENSVNYYSTHSSGIELLAAPKRPEHADVIDSEQISAVIDAVHATSEILFVETQTGLTDHTLQVVEKADQILVTATPGMASLKNARLMIETFEALGLKDRVRLVINQSTASSVVKKSDIPELVKLSEVFYLPYDSKHVSHSLDIGVPIVQSQPKLEFSKGIERLAKKLFAVERSASKKLPFRGLFRIKKSKRLRGKTE